MGIPGTVSRKMFGGWGVYKNGVIFAIITNSALYLKVGEGNRKDFERLGSKPFSYKIKTRKKPVELSYWEAPEEIMENKDTLEKWVEKAVKENAEKYGKK